jgi:uncharacterized protein
VKVILTSFISGIVFALGLGISGMTQPSKVIGFLDICGAWHLSLAFVMIGAIAVCVVAYRTSVAMRSPLLAADFSIPKRSDLNAKLILGAAIFGAGWGLGGFCPGPAIASLASGALPVLIFVMAMGIGMYLNNWVSELSTTASGLAVSPAKSVQDT